MKKTFYSILLALIVGVFTAQAQITQSDMPTIGSSYTYNIDTNAAFVAPGPAGTGQTWSFTFAAADVDSTVVENYVDPASTPNASDFPTATIAMQIDTFNAYGYARATSTVIEDIGMAGDFITGLPAPLPPIKFIPDPVIRMTFPANVGTQFNDYGYVSIVWQNVSVGSPFDPLDELKVNFHLWKTVNVDGSGDLTLNGTTWTNVLRYRVESITRDSVWATKSPFINNLLYRTSVDTSITYAWYSKTLKNDVLRIEYDASEQNIKSVQFVGSYTIAPTKIISLSEAGIVVYPNPAKDFLKVIDSKNVIANVSVNNLLGQTVNTTYENGQIDVSNLAPGMYILEILDRNGNKITSKFIKE